MNKKLLKGMSLFLALIMLGSFVVSVLVLFI